MVITNLCMKHQYCTRITHILYRKYLSSERYKLELFSASNLHGRVITAQDKLLLLLIYVQVQDIIKAKTFPMHTS